MSDSMTSTIDSLSNPGRANEAIKRPRWYQGKKASALITKGLILFILFCGVVVIMIPFLWMISVSLMNKAEIYANPPKWIPSKFLWSNYYEAVTTIPFMRLLRNSLYIVIGRLVGTVLSASLAAYGFARLRAPDRDWLFIVVLATMMLPSSVTLIPQFILFTKLGWVNTMKPLIVPAWFGGGAYNIFLLRQFFMTIPLDYDDAARIDGCGHFRIWWQIILPLSAPVLATVAIFNIMYSWNDFMGPLIYLKSMTESTLALGLYFFQGVYQPEWNHLMAISVLLILPMVIMFFFAQRLFIQGVVITGVKG
ncbi:MAG: carbohydrate ABC transporter permease [Anaerolineales bacterium]